MNPRIARRLAALTADCAGHRDELSFRMSGPVFAGFLPDENSFCLAESIRHYRVLSYDDVGLARGAADEKVIEHARSHGAIVMTRNWLDFKYAMQAFADRSSGGDCQAMRCHEGGGLITVDPSMRSFHFERVSRSLRLGDEEIGWEDVFVLNLRVRIRASGTVAVTFLPRCERCLRDAEDCEVCRTLRVAELYAAQRAAEAV